MAKAKHPGIEKLEQVDAAIRAATYEAPTGVPDFVTVYGYRDVLVDNHGTHWFGFREARDAAVSYAKQRASARGNHADVVDAGVQPCEATVTQQQCVLLLGYLPVS